MTPEAVPYGRKTQRPSPVSDIHILWITAVSAVMEIRYPSRRRCSRY